MTRGEPAGIAVVTVAVFALVALALTARAGAAGPLAGQTVVVDPGHGGSQPGAIAFGVEEKTLNLPIGLALGAALTQAGADVVYTRDADVTVSLQARAALAGSRHAAAFIAVHANSAPDPSIRGVTTYYGMTRPPSLVEASRQLADSVQGAVVASTHEADRGVQTSDAFVLGHAERPAILVETGFMTNPDEERSLTNSEVQRRLARAIADGVIGYLGNGVATATPVAQASGVDWASAPAPPAEAISTPAGVGISATARPATLPRQATPSRVGIAVGVGGGALALGLLRLRHQRISARRRRRMVLRRRIRRHLTHDANG